MNTATADAVSVSPAPKPWISLWIALVVVTGILIGRRDPDDALILNDDIISVINAITNLFMADYDPVFPAINGALVRNKLGRDADFIMIDLHGEATSEKMAVGHYADSRASLVVGTHTHVPTADHQILPGGTAYQTDTGMCGDYDSVIGMNKEAAMARFTASDGPRLSVALGEVSLCGLLVESNEAGHAVLVDPLRRGGRLAATTPGT